MILTISNNCCITSSEDFSLRLWQIKDNNDISSKSLLLPEEVKAEGAELLLPILELNVSLV